MSTAQTIGLVTLSMLAGIGAITIAAGIAAAAGWIVFV